VVALAVALGGAAGSLLRWGLGLLGEGPSWPWTTLGINVAGSLLAGAMAQWGAARLPEIVSTGIIAGVLAGFTTFSAFSVQTVALATDGRAWAATAYVAASVVLGIAAGWVGVLIGQRMTA